MEQNKRMLMIRYLKRYRSKRNILMTDVMSSMIERLESYQPISYKQIKSVLSFLEREPSFKGMNRKQIKQYFDELTKPLLKPNQKEHPYVNLESFFGS